MHVNDLILEVGRKCNMCCEHCLRGPAENVTMPVETAKFAIDQFDTIGNITFTGGEPTLYAKEICEIIDYILENKKEVYGFYIASNGLLVDTDLMLHLAKFYGYIESIACENYSQYQLSTDHYHDEVFEKHHILKGFTFVSYRGDINEAALINEGNAKENGIGHRELDTEMSFSYDEFDTVEMVYVNAKGYLLPDCDYSYQTQDEMKPCHINVLKNGMTLEEIFKTYNK